MGLDGKKRESKKENKKKILSRFVGPADRDHLAVGFYFFPSSDDKMDIYLQPKKR